MFKINPTEKNCNAPEKLSFQLNDINGVCGVPGKLNFEIKDTEDNGSNGGIVNVFDSDNNLLAEVTAPGQYIVNDSLVTIRRENTTIVVTQSVLATQPFDYTVGNTELTLRDEDNNILRVLYLQADTISDETIFNTTVQLKDSAGNNIGTPESYLAESSNNLTAPDGNLTLNGNPFISILSNQTINSLVTDKDGNTYEPYISGNNLRIAKERRHDFQSPYSYCGYAQYLSSEGANVWKVSRITINNDGTTTVGVANNVNWTDRYTHIYT